MRQAGQARPQPNERVLPKRGSAINDEAIPVNAASPSTNRKLKTSKEELQSLNEELTALNSQLHETVEQQRATSNDLRNILTAPTLRYSSWTVTSAFVSSRRPRRRCSMSSPPMSVARLPI